MSVRRALLLALCFVPSAARTQSITVTSPTTGSAVASGGDFATDVIGDPWDMSQGSDVSAYVTDFQSYSIAGGVFTGLTTATPGWVAAISVQYQGEKDTNHVGREGVLFPIDGSKYTKLSLRMYTDKPGYMRFLYFRQPGWINDTASSNYVSLVTGWNVYDIDLIQLGGYCVSASCTYPGWGGTVLGFRIDPNTSNSANVIIDWVRLRAGDSSATTFDVTWSAVDPSGTGKVDLYADSDQNAGNGFIESIASGLSASSGQYGFPVNRLNPGNYYVYAVMGTTYAGNVLLDPWDMSQTTDASWSGFTSASIGGGVFSGQVPNAQAAIFPRMSPTVPIKASAFHYLRLRMNVASDTLYRLVWLRAGDSQYYGTGWQDATAGMKEYVLDLSQFAGFSGDITWLRINPSFWADTVTIDDVSISSSPTDPGGTYTDYSNAPLRVNEVPQIHITDPDQSGGEDYATAVLGNPWDMNDAADVPLAANVTSVSYSGGMYNATSTNNDPAIFSFENNGPLIDAAKYHLFTIAYQVDQPFNVSLGSVARIAWRQSLTGTLATTSQDIIGYPGYNVITLDLSTILIEYLPPYIAPWQGTEAELRFDPTEQPAPIAFHVDSVKLATEDSSSGNFTITWNDSDSDGSALIDLYWDTDSSGYDGTLIAAGIPEDSAQNSYAWNSGTAPTGPIWIYARISDGLDTLERYATGVLVNNATDSLPPYLTLLSPAKSATGVSPYTAIVAHVRDTGTGVDMASILMRVNGATVAPTITGSASDVKLHYQPGTAFTVGQTVTVRIDADDLVATPNHLTDTYSFTVTTATDSDGDGMPDQFEVASDLDPFDASGPEGTTGDPDRDGAGNLAEYQAGTDPTSWAQLVLGPGPSPSNPPYVRIFYPEGTVEPSFSKVPYGVNKWGVNVGAGSIESQTARAVLSGPGPGDVFGPQVRAFRPDNTDINKVNFYAYGTLRYGVHAQSGDTDGDAYAEILTSPGRGAVFGPHIRGFNFDGSAVQAIAGISFFAYSTLKYGAHVSSGDVEADGFDEILTAPGPGVPFGPTVRGFNVDGVPARAIAKINFYALPTAQYGAEVAGGDVEGDGFSEILAGPGPGPANGALLRGYDYDGASIAAIAGISATSFTTSYGLTVAAGDLDGDRIAEPIAGVGPDPSGTCSVMAYDYSGGNLTPLPGSPFIAYTGLSYGTRVAAGVLGF